MVLVKVKQMIREISGKHCELHRMMSTSRNYLLIAGVEVCNAKPLL